MKKDLILGVDPGLTGGLALYSQKTKALLWVKAMPRSPRKKSSLDLKAIKALIFPHRHNIRFAAIEDVHSMPNQGVASTFTFGLVTGMIHGVCGGLDIRILPIKPNVWKPGLGLSRDKKQSLALAQKLFPAFSSDFTRTTDDGKAEAALIARFVGMAFKKG